MRAGGDVRSDLEAGVAANLHVLLPRVVSGEARLAVAGVACGRGTALRFSADAEPLDEFPVEADVERLRPAHAFDVVLILPLQADLDEVFAGNGKVVMDRRAAARSERQILALPIVLHHEERDLESLEARTRGRESDSEARHLARDGEIAFEVRGGNRQRVGEVVEAAVGGFIAGQKRFGVEVDREQIADRVVVFGAIEPMHGGDPPGIRFRIPRAIHLLLQPARDRAICCFVRTRAAGRRHRTRPQLRDDFFPRLRVRARRVEIQAFQIEPAGLQPGAVAADAVLIEDGLGCLFLLKLGAYLPAGQDQADRDGDKSSPCRHSGHFALFSRQSPVPSL